MPKVGDVHVEARIDGDRMPADLRKYMQQVGQVMDKEAREHGESYAENLSTSLGRTLAREGRRVMSDFSERIAREGRDGGLLTGRTYGDAMREALRDRIDDAVRDLERLHSPDGFASLVRDAGDVDAAMRRMNDSLRLASDYNRLTDRDAALLGLELRVQRAAFDEASEAARRNSEEMARNAEQSRQAREWVERLRSTHRDWVNTELAQVGLMLRNTNGAFDEHARRLGGVDRAYADLDSRIRVLGTEMDGGWIVRASNALGALGRSIFSVGGEASSAGDKVNKNFMSAWRDLPHNGRQWILIIASIAAAMQHIATLGSAAGAGILVLGGAITAGLAGVGAIVASFQGLTKEMGELPAHVRPAAASFQGIGTAFGDLAREIQSTALQGASTAFDRIAASVRNLAPAFQPMAGVVNRLIGDFADWTYKASETEGALSELVRNSAPSFDMLARVVGTFGDALVDAFGSSRMQSSVQKLIGWLQDLGDQFHDFVNSADFDQWLDEADRVFGAVGDLIASVGRTLDDLVTPKAMSNLTDLLESVSRLTPALGNLLGVIGNLDIFGILAAALESVLTVLDPLYRALEPVASIIRDGLMVALDGLMVILTPVRLGLELFGSILQAVGEHFAPLNDMASTAMSTLVQMADQLISALKPAFDVIADALLALFPNFESLADLVEFGATVVLEQFASFIETHVVPAVEAFASFIKTHVVPAVEAFSSFIETHVIPTLDFFGGAMNTVIGWLGGVGKALGFTGEDAKRTNNAMKTMHEETKRSADDWAAKQQEAFRKVNQATEDYMNKTLNARDANRNFEAALDDAREALEKNGNTLDITTEAGRENEQALDDIAAAAYRVYKETLNRTGSEVQATKALSRGREELIQMAKQFGLTDAQAAEYADQLGLIPDDVRTTAVLSGGDDVERRLQQLTASRRMSIYVDQHNGRNYSSVGWGRGMASGGRVYGPTRALIGEAGPEAVVPLSRPLSQVDPSVRWLSAIAQGKYAPQAMASGGVASGSQVNVAPGAIQILGSLDPRRTAIETVDELVERIA